MNLTLITTNNGLSQTLLRLIKTYPNSTISVAWASAGTKIFTALCSHRDQITKAIIGTHFYQTHPDVLDEFVGAENVRFMLQPSGVFHPKVYAFWDESNWEVLIGSANLTAGALNKNSEAMVLITGSNQDQSMLSDVTSLIDSYWEDAKPVSQADAEVYRALWKKQQKALRKVSGQYGEQDTSKAPIDSAVMSMSWEGFLSKVTKDPYHGFDERCALLKLINNAFKTHESFVDMELGLRKTIGGLPTDFNEHWAWFGSMKGAGYYHQAVNNNNPHISRALDTIPLNGSVSRDQYNTYIDEFVQAFPNGRHGVGVASRLLAMKRPDQFVCFNSKNKTELCRDFGIKQSDMDYSRYWEDVIERITDSVWWNEPRPADETAGTVWDGRAAMLDTIFYRP